MQKIAIKNSLLKILKKEAKKEGITVAKMIENLWQKREQDPLEFFLQNCSPEKQKFLAILFKVLPKFDVDELRSLLVSYQEIYPEVFPQEKT